MRSMLLMVACLMLLTAPAQAANVDSANRVMEGCRATLQGKSPASLSGAELYKLGWCHGAVNALVGVSEALPEPFKFCAPVGATNEQSVRIVVAYIDAAPHRTHLPFVVLATEALRKAWPCRPAAR